MAIYIYITHINIKITHIDINFIKNNNKNKLTISN